MKRIKWIPIKAKYYHSGRKRRMGEYIIFEKVGKQSGYILINEILEKFTSNFVVENELYHSHTSGDWAFNYKEKQLHSVMFPALNKSVNACLLELPFTRTIGETKKNGYIDYLLVQWKRTQNYILTEVKHIKIYPEKKYLNNLSKKWENLLEQLDSLKGKELTKYRRNGKVFKLGFLIAPIILNYSQSYSYDDNELLTIIENIKAQLKIKPSWISVARCNFGSRMYYKKSKEETGCLGLIILGFVSIEKN